MRVRTGRFTTLELTTTLGSSHGEESNHLHPEAYHEATFHIDPASFLRPLAERLPPCAVILDVGCGSGRDLRWLRHRGFRAVGMERSPGKDMTSLSLNLQPGNLTKKHHLTERSSWPI